MSTTNPKSTKFVEVPCNKIDYEICPKTPTFIRFKLLPELQLLYIFAVL